MPSSDAVGEILVLLGGQIEAETPRKLRYSLLTRHPSWLAASQGVALCPGKLALSAGTLASAAPAAAACHCAFLHLSLVACKMWNEPKRKLRWTFSKRDAFHPDTAG